MKKYTYSIGATALALALIVSSSAHAMTASTSATLNAYTSEKSQLMNTQADIKATIAAFKQNLAQVKSSTPEQKRTFAVDVYAKANTFFTTEHDQFVVALNTAASNGVDVSSARAHFDKAWQLLLQANTDAKSLADMNLTGTTSVQAKAYAVKAEDGYKQVRSELRAGAVSLKTAIIAHYNLNTPVGTVSGSSSASVSTQ